MVVIQSPRNFRPVDGSQMQNASQYFDSNRDGRLSTFEISNAAGALRYFGSVFGNSNLTNLGDAFDRMGYELRFGNRAIDGNGDGQVSINGFNSELSTAIRRNNPSQFEVADLRTFFPPPPPLTNFNSVSRSNAQMLFNFADRNGDGRATTAEMRQAKGILDQFGFYQNYSNVLQRFIEEVDSGNRNVDLNGDGAIAYRDPPPIPNGLVLPSELNQIIDRNNPNFLETADLTRVQIPPIPVGLRAFPV